MFYLSKPLISLTLFIVPPDFSIRKISQRYELLVVYALCRYLVGTISSAPGVGWGWRVLLSISKLMEKRDRQAAWQQQQHKGGKQSGPSENHPQNNLYQNSFCQQILWRESPFGQKNLLMHFTAHNSSTGLSSSLSLSLAILHKPTDKPLETHWSMLRFVCCVFSGSSFHVFFSMMC